MLPAEEGRRRRRQTTRKSFFISADTAHAVHPNWAAKHEASHTPKLNGGTVIKSNDNQRYATNAPTGFVVRELARRSKTSVQEFMVRNDCPCGMTIGPMVASKTGVRTVDVGVASLSMHSIRETVGADDGARPSCSSPPSSASSARLTARASSEGLGKRRWKL